MTSSEFLENTAVDIANEFDLDADAILDKNDKIFYFLTGNEVIEVDRKTHLSKCIMSKTNINFNKVNDLIIAIKVLQSYFK